MRELHPVETRFILYDKRTGSTSMGPAQPGVARTFATRETAELWKTWYKDPENIGIAEYTLPVRED